MDNLPLPNLPYNQRVLDSLAFAKKFRNIPCGDPKCIADHEGGDNYCIHEFLQSVTEAGPEAPEGVGAAVISPGTLDTPETPETAVEAFDTITFPRAHGLEVGQVVEVNGESVTITAILSETQVTYKKGTEIDVEHAKKMTESEKAWKRWTESWLEGIDYKTQIKPRTGRRLFRNNRAGDGKQRQLPRVRGCGHKLDMKRQPRHRNCKPCWTAFFRNQDEMAENIAKIIVEQGSYRIVETFGIKFLTRFREYCNLVERMEALRLAYQEEQNVGIELATIGDENTGQSVGGDAETSIEVG